MSKHIELISVNILLICVNIGLPCPEGARGLKASQL